VATNRRCRLAALRKLLDRAIRLPDYILLLHCSQHCNWPHLMRRLFDTSQRIASRLTLAQHHERTRGWGAPTDPLTRASSWRSRSDAAEQTRCSEIFETIASRAMTIIAD